MRQDGVVQYLLGDHLGTTSLVLDDQGGLVAESRHYHYGAERWTEGTLPTDYRFTGQKHEESLGLYQMGARWYDPSLGRWLSADTLVPDPSNPQSFNRYSWVLGNPLRFIDPSGHFSEDQIMQHFGVDTWEKVLAIFEEGGELEGQWGWLEVLRQADFGAEVTLLRSFDQGWNYATIAKRVFEECDGGICSISNILIRQAQAFEMSGPGQRGRWPTHHRAKWFWADAKYMHSRIDWDKADRTGAALDAIGIFASVLGANPVVETFQISPDVAKAAQLVDTGLNIYGLVDATHDLESTDIILSLGGFIPGPIGGGFNLASLFFNIKDGYLYTP